MADQDARTAYRNALDWLRQYPARDVEQMLIDAVGLDQPPPVTASQQRRKTVSIDAAADMVGVSRRTLYLWMDAGKIEFIRTAGGRRRLFVDSLWRASGKKPDG